MPIPMRYLIIFLMLTYSEFINAQYASGISRPDRDAMQVDYTDWAYKLASTIARSELKEHVFHLASDEFEGRETGTEGNEKAARYLAGQFAKMKLTDVDNRSYFQPVTFTFSSWDKTELRINDQSYKHLKDYIIFPHLSNSVNIHTGEIVFLGYGIDDEKYSDYRGEDVTNKVLIVFDGEPMNSNGDSRITGSDELSKWSLDWRFKSRRAKEKGAAALIIISNNFKELVNNNRRQLVNRVTQLGNNASERSEMVGTIFISSTAAQDILGDYRSEVIQLRNSIASGSQVNAYPNYPVDFAFDTKIKRSVIEGKNVMGIIEGTDYKDELLILTAHYDHVGKRNKDVFNGADDNASGTTTILEIAEAFSLAARLNKGPKRSVMFLLVTGEEKGLLGSQYYTEHPVFQLENTIANINIDMVGRRGKEYENSGDPYIYVIGSDRISRELHDINESMNQKYSGLVLDYKYNDEQDPNRFYYRSDHYNFAKRGIPSIFFFNGVHSDYHRSTDTSDKIDLDLMLQRVRHIFHVAWELANRGQRIAIDNTSAP